MPKFGIDISKWQGDFNIDEAKNNGVEFAIIKIGGGDNGLYNDIKFENNYNKCVTASVPKGCYFFGKALTIEQARKEAEYWLSLMNGYNFELPVFYDVEGCMLNNDRSTLTSIVKTVCEILEEHGYWVGIYSSQSVFNNKFNDNELSQYVHWVARWSTQEPILSSGNKVDLWQFGGEVNYIRNNKINNQIVDQNYCYIDYNTKPNTVRKADMVIVSEVLSGKWGNGAERKERLEANGYDYYAIQSIINKYFNNKSKKSLEEIAYAVVRGDYGNGTERRTRIEAEGFDYNEVQQLVNKLLEV